jgi:hypothetical protein
MRRMSIKKSILYFLSIVYAVILLHNITPHVHGSDNTKTFALLPEWFQLLFGKDHSEIQDNQHLSTFSVQEEDEYNYTFAFEISDVDVILPDAKLYCFKYRNINLTENDIIYLRLSDIFWKSPQQCNFTGRAPPHIAENIF